MTICFQHAMTLRVPMASWASLTGKALGDLREMHRLKPQVLRKPSQTGNHVVALDDSLLQSKSQKRSQKTSMSSVLIATMVNLSQRERDESARLASASALMEISLWTKSTSRSTHSSARLGLANYGRLCLHLKRARCRKNPTLFPPRCDRRREGENAKKSTERRGRSLCQIANRRKLLDVARLSRVEHRVSFPMFHHSPCRGASRQ